METNTESLKSKAMKKEFAIKCNTWEEVCDLVADAMKLQWQQSMSLSDKLCLRSHFINGCKLIHFNPNHKTFGMKIWFEPEIPYSKQKAIELLSGNEEEELKIDSVGGYGSKDKIYTVYFNDMTTLKIDCNGNPCEPYPDSTLQKYMPLVNKWLGNKPTPNLWGEWLENLEKSCKENPHEKYFKTVALAKETADKIIANQNLENKYRKAKKKIKRLKQENIDMSVMHDHMGNEIKSILKELNRLFPSLIRENSPTFEVLNYLKNVAEFKQ